MAEDLEGSIDKEGEIEGLDQVLVQHTQTWWGDTRNWKILTSCLREIILASDPMRLFLCPHFGNILEVP